MLAGGRPIGAWNRPGWEAIVFREPRSAADRDQGRIDARRATVEGVRIRLGVSDANHSRHRGPLAVLLLQLRLRRTEACPRRARPGHVQVLAQPTGLGS